jgi:hypothetical protein
MPVRLREVRDLFFRIEDDQIMVQPYAVKGGVRYGDPRRRGPARRGHG